MMIEFNNKFKMLKLYYEGMRPCVLCREYNIPPGAFFYWRAKYPKEVVFAKKNNNPTMRFDKMISHLKKIEAENEFFKKNVVKKMSLRERMAIIDREYGKDSLHVQCDALCVNRSTYLNHKKRNKNENAWFKLREAEYCELIKEIYEDSGRVYGAPKIAAIMRKKGKVVSREYVRRIMINLGLRSVRSMSNKDYVYFARRAREAGNVSLLHEPDGIDQVWVGDTTTVTIKEKRYYICVYLDLFSRRVVGWGVGCHNSTQLTKRTFVRAYMDRKPKSLTLHADNGLCFDSYTMNKYLKEKSVMHSFSRPRIPHDNAAMESFFWTMKRFLFNDGYPGSRRELTERVEIFVKKYNVKDPHGSLDYLSPDEFERKLADDVAR